MSEQETSAHAESSEQDGDPAPQNDQDTSQESPGTDEPEQNLVKEDGPSTAEEIQQDEQEESSGPKQDSDPTEASPGTGTEASPETGAEGAPTEEESPSAVIEEGKDEQEPPSGPKQDSDPTEASPGTGTEASPETGTEGAPKEEESPSAVTEEGKDKQEPSSGPKEDPGAAQAGPGTDPKGVPEKAEESEQAKDEESKEPSPGTAEPQASQGASAGDEVPEKKEQASTVDEKPAEKGDDAKVSTASTEDPQGAAAAEAEEASPGQKVAIVTGANNGVGLVAAEKLARDGYEVIMACRNEEKARKAMGEVEKKVPGAKVTFMKLDLSSLRTVREFADAFHSLGKPLNVLCNNAGLTTGFSSGKERLLTEESFEMTFGVNHLGHFLLTHLLLDELKRTAAQCGEARIVHTASMVHDPDTSGGKRGPPAHLDFDNLMQDKAGTFDSWLAYKNSKLANCTFSVELAKRLEGTNVTSNTLCPGFIPSSGLMQNEPLGTKIRLVLLTPIFKLFGVTRTLEHGGGVIHDVATNPEWKGLTGKHFSDFKEIPSSKESRDPEVGKKLWDISADLVKYEQAKAV